MRLGSHVTDVKSVRAAGSWQGSMTTALRVRDFELATDEPEAIGGTNSAPTPMEVLAAAANGCITVTIETVAREFGFQLDAIETASHAHMDTRGFYGTAEVSPHFIDYALRVHVTTPETPERFEALRAAVERRCPALNLLRDAGVPVALEWEHRPA